MRTANVLIALKGAVERRRPILLAGEPGVGKTELGKKVVRELKSEIILSHPVVNDPTDAKGLPWPDPDGKGANFLPYGHLRRALEAKKPTVWFLDDLGQAPPAVQASFMQLILERSINSHKIPNCVTFIAATNGRGHRAGVQGILEPVKSRFISIINVEANYEDWKSWAYTDGAINPLVTAFLNLRANPRYRTQKLGVHQVKAKNGEQDEDNWEEDQLFNRFRPTADLVNCPSPRTWEHVSQILEIGYPEEVEEEMIRGAVGEAAGREFAGFLKLRRDLPNPDAILVDPDQARLPVQPSSLYAVCAALVNRTTKDNFDRVVRYAQRIYDAEKGDIAALLVRDCQRWCPEVQDTRAYEQMIHTDFGKLLTV